METKADLKKKNKSLNEINDAKSNQIYDLDRKVRRLESDVSVRESERDNYKGQQTAHETLLNKIVEILSGDAQQISKVEVIEDLLRPEVENRKKRLSEIKKNPEMNRRW